MEQILLTSLVVVATLLGAGMVVPQILRLHRTENTDGVSVAWIGVGVAMNSWWTAYALGVELWSLLPVSVSGVLLYVTLAMQMFRLRGAGQIRGFLLGVITVGVIPLPALLLGGLEAAGIVIGLSYAVQFSPAVRESLRSKDLLGLSPSTWLMAFGEAVIWFVYGAAVVDVALIIGGAGGAVASAVILTRLYRVLRPRIVLTGLTSS